MEVVGAVFLEDERVLACRRAPGLQAGGRWEFPGGKLQDGESPQVALERELAEELDVEVEVGELLDRTTSLVDGVEVSLACYFVRSLGEAPAASTDHDVVAWFARERLTWLNWAEPDWPAVRRLVFATGS